MKKMHFWFVIMTCVFFTSCEFLNLDSDEYYNQQNDNTPTQGNISEDIDVHFSEIFEILQPNGVVDIGSIPNAEAYESQLNQLPKIMFENDPSFSLIDFTNTDFSSNVLQANYDENNIMLFSYVTNAAWTLSENYDYLQSNSYNKNNVTYESVGPDIGSGMTLLSPITYYKYEGYNPLFLLESNYNQTTFGVSNERGMERFMFYRFIGMGGDILEVDTMLFAVDTYTSLIYIYAIPTELDIVIEMPMTTAWGAVDNLASDEAGNKHLFFEYDPIGYVDANYNFIMYDWYIKRQAEIDPTDLTTYFPRFTGVSPYLINVDVENN